MGSDYYVGFDLVGSSRVVCIVLRDEKKSL